MFKLVPWPGDTCLLNIYCLGCLNFSLFAKYQQDTKRYRESLPLLLRRNHDIHDKSHDICDKDVFGYDRCPTFKLHKISWVGESILDFIDEKNAFHSIISEFPNKWLEMDIGHSSARALNMAHGSYKLALCFRGRGKAPSPVLRTCQWWIKSAACCLQI